MEFNVRDTPSLYSKKEKMARKLNIELPLLLVVNFTPISLRNVLIITALNGCLINKVVQPRGLRPATTLRILPFWAKVSNVLHT